MLLLLNTRCWNLAPKVLILFMKLFLPLLVHMQDYDASQDDDASCFITGPWSATIFLPHQLPRARSLLSIDEEEDLVVIPKMETLKEGEEHLR